MGVFMIDTTKVKKMTKVAMYENGIGREDIRIYQKKESTYIAFRLIESWICITIAYALAVCLYCLRYVNDFAVEGLHSFKTPLLVVTVIYLILVAIGLIITWFIARKRYHAAHRRILRYDRNLEYLDKYNKE